MPSGRSPQCGRWLPVPLAGGFPGPNSASRRSEETQRENGYSLSREDLGAGFLELFAPRCQERLGLAAQRVTPVQQAAQA